ncbi:MAG: biotin--[acetyl-CoA-carboxylase] ligase [Bacillota bacterium]
MDKIKEKIIEILHKNSYYSGQQLSDKLGISRTAVWKHIQDLKDKGYIINSKHGRGYLLKSSPDLMLAEELKWRLNTDIFGCEIEHHMSIASTNKRAKELADKNYPEGTIIIAEEQTEGRGRRGREWISPVGKGLWFSLIVRPRFIPAMAPFLTIIASLSVSLSIKELNLNPVIKWPNDILINGKKACGILSELKAEMDRIEYGIVGIGINVNQSNFSEEIKKKATSLSLEKREQVDRIDLFKNLVNNFEKYYLKLNNDEYDELINKWKYELSEIGKRVRLDSGDKIYQGEVVDVSSKGELIVNTDKEGIKKFWAGDTSIIK